MLHTCPSGCEVDVGMSRSRQLNRCKDHDEVLRYAKPLTRKEPASPSPAKPRKGMKTSKKDRDWEAARAKVDEEVVCRVCGSNENVEAAHVIGRECDEQRGSKFWVNPDSIVPLCGQFSAMKCHSRYDAHELDVLEFLTPAEQIQAVKDAGGIESARRRTSPSSYRILEATGAALPLDASEGAV